MRIPSSIRSPLFLLVLLATSAAAFAQFSISVSFAPPELPVYEQPLCPGDGYLWTPGYWAYADDNYGYYWVPGTWVMAPEPGLLWTPAYWGWGGNGFVFNEGYWGTQVGFYGGISYGYGYFGDGYEGGRWQNGQFYYNRSVSNVNVTNIHNVYNTTVINNTTTINRVSYNGGNGGISARPTPQQEAVVHERHIPPVAAQAQHAQAARANPEQRASLNHGTPAVAATPKPGAFSDRAVVPAKQTGAPYNAPVNRAAVPPTPNAPTAHPENNAARSDRPAPNSQPNRPAAEQPTQLEPNKPEPNRPAAERPTQLEPNKPEPNRPSAERPTQPEPNKPEPNRVEPSRPPTAQSNSRPEPNRPELSPPETTRPLPVHPNDRPEPAPRPQTAPPSERSQPERTPPVAEPRSAPPQRPDPGALKAEEKKQQNEEPKRDEKPQ